MHLLRAFTLLHLCLHSITACGEGWTWVKSLNGCFFISATSTRWKDAKKNCERKNSQLVNITEENLKFLNIAIADNTTAKYWTGTVNNVTYSRKATSDEETCFTINYEGVETSSCDTPNGYICQQDGSKMMYRFYDACIQRERLTCYWITRTTEQFIEANNHCSDEDGHLVHIYDRKEEYFIYSLISLNYENNGAKYWLDWNKEGKWINNTFKLSKEPLTLSDDDNCAIISYNNDTFQKVSANCRTFAYSICQKIAKNYNVLSEPDCLSCPQSWLSYQLTEMCYWISNNKTRNWQDAENYCQNFGGNLITYANNLEEHFILSILPESVEDYWIGLKYSHSRYKWSEELEDEDAAWTRRNFKRLNGTEGSDGILCVFYNQKAKEWLHGNCELSKGFICKGGKTEVCDKNWKLFSGNCYKIESSLAFTWHRALMYCKDNNGSLSSIHSTEELQFLSRMIKQTDANALFWIGLHKSGIYIEWSDSSPIQYLFDNMPNLKHEEERCISLNHQGSWLSKECATKRGFICKKASYSNAYTSTVPTTDVISEEENCPKDWLHFGNKCYLYEKEDKSKLTWREANRKCSSLGSDLVSIQSSKEQDYLTFLLDYYSKSAWIGFNSINNQKTFHWSDNSSVEYTNWMEGAFSSLESKYCVKMVAPDSKDEFTAGKWSPAICDSRLGYICQKRISSTRLATVTTLRSLETCNKPRDWIKFKNRCYKMLNWSNLWLKADFQCKKYNSRLVTISNSSLNVFVQFIMSSYNISTTWIGLSRNKKFRYKWISGWPVLFTNWGKDQPGREGSCTVMLHSGQWMTKSCLEKFPFLCETTSDLIPNPSSDKFGVCSKTDGWKDIGEMCYYFESDALLSLPEAKLECYRRGGSLISLHSVEELNIISKYIKYTSTSYWIGLIRKHDGSFSWTDYTPVNFVYWDDNEPTDNYRDNCVEMHRKSKKWSMADCAYKRGYICTKNKNEINEDGQISIKDGSDKRGSLHPSILIAIIVGSVFLLIGAMYLFVVCIKKNSKKDSPMITDSNEDSMTYSNVVFTDDLSDESHNTNT